ncbi:MAG TPA: metalloregulator ArsR/SmtB family transcription factor, partial [Fimbriimonadaceae bacterium]|nr:metalloregulator ArsR/SmtB family transcription factor [Fimbriimonadaceae bacterium]
MDSDSVWRALTSPHRRKVLELLRDGPLTTGQITKSLPGLSRFAVMQHLGVLEEAMLVLPRKEGRTRLNFINPAPIREQYDRWVSGFGSAAAETTQHLKRYAESKVEEQEMMNEEGFRVVRIELECEISAPPSVVFDALTKNLNEWWPHRMVPGSVVSHDCRHGGQISETWEGGGALYGTIVIFEAG